MNNNNNNRMSRRNVASRQQRRGEVLFEHKKFMTNYYTLSYKNLGDKIAENLASSFQKFCPPNNIVRQNILSAKIFCPQCIYATSKKNLPDKSAKISIWCRKFCLPKFLSDKICSQTGFRAQNLNRII